MGDFYLDLRTGSHRDRTLQTVTKSLRWMPESVISSFVADKYALIVGHANDSGTWSPAVAEIGRDRVIVALAGRVALTREEWAKGECSHARGGLACRVLAEQYLQEGLSSLERLNGNFCLIVADEVHSQIHVVTDQAGLQIAYTGTVAPEGTALCSHPDVLADALGQSDDLDLVSIGEFVTTGQLSFPHTYYRKIKALAQGSVFSYSNVAGQWTLQTQRRYFEMSPDFRSGATIGDLSDRLASALQHAVRLRTLPQLGNVAIAASGGMDSRAILSSIEDTSRVRGFVLIDKENPESRAAQAIAQVRQIELDVIKRPFDYYGSTALAGARIGGGSGGLASNHFLGIASWLKQHQIATVLTGCYCDYLFKALALNTRETRILRRETLAPFALEFYRPVFRDVTQFESVVDERIRERLPYTEGADLNDEKLFEVETSRTFPLAYEGDCAQRVIGQRVLPWSLPMADRGLLEIYRQIPSKLKLNSELFRQVLRKICSPAMLEIPNSNNGASILAPLWLRSFYRYRSALLNRVVRHRSRGLAGRGSWPDWEYYIRHSLVIKRQWDERQPVIDDVLGTVIAPAFLNLPPTAFRGRQVELFQRIWTLKVWLTQRVGSHIAPDRALAESASEPQCTPGLQGPQQLWN